MKYLCHRVKISCKTILSGIVNWQPGRFTWLPGEYVSLYPCQHILGEKRRNGNSYINTTNSVLMSLIGFHILTKIWYWQPYLLKISWCFYGHISEKFWCLLTKYIFVCYSVSLTYCMRQQLDFWTRMLVLIYYNTNLPFLSGWGTYVCVGFSCIILCWIN